MQDQYEFEQKIKAYIKQDGRSQAAIARKLNYAPDTFNRWIRGFNRMPDRVIHDFCRLLGLDHKQLIELLDLAGHAILPTIDPKLPEPKEKTINQLVTQRTLSPLQPTTPNNLPARLTSFVGREYEVTALYEFLKRPNVRLITLTGTGGSGKTSLAIQAAAGLLRDFPHGVFFISLAPIRDSELVLSTIAQVLQVKEARDKPLLESLQTYIQPQQMLLLLDNFEQVIAAASNIVYLLNTCTSLKILVTSRERLHLSIEYEFSLQPLEQAAANALFVQRAQTIQSHFSLNDANGSVISEICARLDNLPLAIELAAARIKALSPQDILARLNNRFQLLQGGPRDVPDRQRTLRATIDWSHDLLDDDERILFRRLAVFMGGRTLEAVEQICNASNDNYIRSFKINVLDGLSSLLDKNLLYNQEGADGVRRFLMLVTIHEYASERLVESGEIEFFRNRHAAYYLELAERARKELRGQAQATWLTRLETEHDNLRAALQWAGEQGDKETELRLSGALYRFWYMRSHLSEGRRWLQQALTQSDNASSASRALAFRGAGWLARFQGDYLEAISLLEKSLNIFRTLENGLGIASVLNDLGTIAEDQGDYERSKSLHEESLILFRRLEEDQGIASVLNNLSNLFFFTGDMNRAVSLYLESLALYRMIGDKHGIAYVTSNLGICWCFQGDYKQAKVYIDEALSLFQEIDDKWGIGVALCNLGDVAHGEGNYEQAKKLHMDSIEIRIKIGDKEGIVESLEAFAWLACTQQQIERATYLYSKTTIMRKEISNPLPPIYRERYDSNLSSLKLSFGNLEFARIWAAGQTMTLEQAVNYALEHR